nr:organic cation transporter protein [Hymenolepis microstoma]
MHSEGVDSLSTPPSCDACNSLPNNPVTIGCGHSFCKKCMKHDDTKQFIICPSCKILGSVSILQSDDELSERIKHFLSGCSSLSAKSIQCDSGYEMFEEGEPPTEYHRRFVELNDKFIKKEWINSPVAQLDDLFTVLKNICSVYLIYAKDCLISLNALHSLPINDSPLSSLLTFFESLDRNPSKLSHWPIIAPPINELTESCKENLVEIITHLLDTVELGLKILSHLYKRGPGLNKNLSDNFLIVLHDNLRSIGRDILSRVINDQLYLRHRTAKRLEILDPATNQPIDLESFKPNGTPATDSKPNPLFTMPAEVPGPVPDADGDSLSRMIRSAPPTPSLGNDAEQQQRMTLEIRDPHTNERIKLPGSPTETGAPKENENPEVRPRTAIRKPTPMTIVDPKTKEPINLPEESVNASEELVKPNSPKIMTIIDPETNEPVNLPQENMFISEEPYPPVASRTMTIIDPETNVPINLSEITSKNTTGCVAQCEYYESNDGYSSYATEWGLICKDKYLLRIAQITHMGGLFVGAFSCGPFADRFGRLRVLYTNLAIMCLLSFVTICLRDIYSFCLVTFLLGVCCQGCGLTSYTLILEAVGEKYRALCGILEQVFYAFGIALTALLAYCIPNWRNLAAVFAIAGPIAFIIMLPFQIESTRWLLTQPTKRLAALKNLKYITRINGTLLPSNGSPNHINSSNIFKFFDSLHDDDFRTSRVEEASDTDALIDGSSNARTRVDSYVIAKESFCTLCTHPLLRKWTLLFSICWFSNAAAYYGSTIASGEAFTNRFISFALSGLVEIPGHCLSPWLMNTYGRRKFHSYLQILGGVFFSLVLPMACWHEAAVLIVATLAKLCIAMSFASAYVFASEVYPTSIINAAIGFCVTCGRLGGTVAPALLALGREISCLIFGAITLVSGIAALYLPETLGHHMPPSSLQLVERT